MGEAEVRVVLRCAHLDVEPLTATIPVAARPHAAAGRVQLVDVDQQVVSRHGLAKGNLTA